MELVSKGVVVNALTHTHTHTRWGIVGHMSKLKYMKMLYITHRTSEHCVQLQTHWSGNKGTWEHQETAKACTCTWNKKAVVEIVLKYTAQHGLVLPGRVPGFSQTDINVFFQYVQKTPLEEVQRGSSECEQFCQLWQTQVPANKRPLLAVPAHLKSRGMQDISLHCCREPNSVDIVSPVIWLCTTSGNDQPK